VHFFPLRVVQNEVILQSSWQLILAIYTLVAQRAKRFDLQPFGQTSGMEAVTAARLEITFKIEADTTLCAFI